MSVVMNATTGGLNVGVSVAATTGGSRACREVTQVGMGGSAERVTTASP